MRHGRTSPFAVMSRRPGIGTQYLTAAMRDWHKSERKNYMLMDGQKRHLPKFYKDKILSKIDRVRISNRAQRDSLDSLRAELLKLGKHHANAMEYREERLRQMAKRIRNKSKQPLTL